METNEKLGIMQDWWCETLILLHRILTTHELSTGIVVLCRRSFDGASMESVVRSHRSQTGPHFRASGSHNIHAMVRSVEDILDRCFKVRFLLISIKFVLTFLTSPVARLPAPQTAISLS